MVVAAANVVPDGAGVPSTEKVKPSRLALPVPVIMNNDPTVGTNAPTGVNVNVTTSLVTLYAVTTRGCERLLEDVVKVGGAPGPDCDSG